MDVQKNLDAVIKMLLESGAKRSRVSVSRERGVYSGHVDTRIEHWATRRGVVLVAYYLARNGSPEGWDIYIPITDSCKVDVTLDTLHVWLSNSAS